MKVPEPFDRNHPVNGLTNQREHTPRPGMKEEWLIIYDQILIEREPSQNVDRRADPVNPLRNFVDSRARLSVSDHNSSLSAPDV